MYTSRSTLLRLHFKRTVALPLTATLLLLLSACTIPQPVVVPNEDGQQEAVEPAAEPQEETTQAETTQAESAETAADEAPGGVSDDASSTASDTEASNTEASNTDASNTDASDAADSAESAAGDSAESGESAATSIIAAVSATTVPEEEPEAETAEAMDDEDAESMAAETTTDESATDESVADESAEEEGGERSVITVGDLLNSADSNSTDSDNAGAEDAETTTVGDVTASDGGSAEDVADADDGPAPLTVGDILASGQGATNTASTTAPATGSTAATSPAPAAPAPAAPAPTAVPIYYVEIDSGTNNLNVRAEPNSGAEIVDKLPTGTIVQYFPSESQGEWYKIPQGWISSAFTKAARVDAQSTSSPSGSTNGSSLLAASRLVGIQNADSPYVVTGQETVPLRSGPNEAFPAVATATPGRAYEIQGIDRTREWYQVLVPGINDLVWIAAKDVDAIGALNDIPIRSGASSSSSELPTAGNSDNTVRVPPQTSDPPDEDNTLSRISLAATASPLTPTPTAPPPTPVPTQRPQPTAPPTAPPPTPTLTAEQAAYYAALAANQNSAAGPQAPAQAPVQQAPVQQAPVASYPAAPGFFGYGVQAHMLGGGIGQAVNATAELGFNWIKQQVQWREFEGSPGAIDFSELRRIVDAAGSRNISVLFSVVNAPDWAREPGFDGGVGGPPADPQTMATFVGRIAADFCGSSLKAIEVWNEQNLHYEWGNKPLNPAEYMNLLRASHASIKTACPSMIVISGALTPAGPNGNFAMDDFQYLEMMYQNGLTSYADAIGAHPSGYNVPPNITWDQACAAIQQTGNQFNGACDNPHHSWSFRSTMEGYRNIMQVYGDAGKRIWPTEFGWAADGAFDPRYAYANDNSLEEQKNWTVEAYQMMRAWGWVGPAFLWNLNFRVIANGTEKAQWGIVRNDYSPLPVYNALRAMPK